MKQYKITLTLLEDVVISQRAASMGGHQSLDYIPGAVLLGACAARLYDSLTIEQSYQLFHSGQVRFCNAYPLSKSGQQSMPMPVVWKYKKGRQYLINRDGDRFQLDTDIIKQVSQATENDGVQYVQLRSGYLTDDLEVLRPTQSLRMKTAINPDTARASQSQLFGYQSLQAGQAFVARLDVDDEALELAEQAITAIRGSLFIGRSRSAQYGKVKCEIDAAYEAADMNDSLGTELTLWLQSDMALQDQYGKPLMFAQAESLPGLPNSTINWRDSQLRFRRYSPFNSKRRSYDTERQVIEKGSVLNITLDKPLTQAQWEILQGGIGLYRESGLGQVLVNHCLTDEDKIKQCKAFDAVCPNASVPEQPNSALARWIAAKVDSHDAMQSDKKYAEKLNSELRGLYQNARRYYGVESHITIGPSASQWSQIVELSKKYKNNKAKLLAGCFDVNNGICRLKGSEKSRQQSTKEEGWQIIVFIDEQGKEKSFSDWLEQALSHQEIKDVAYVASLVARRGADYLKKQKGAHDDT